MAFHEVIDARIYSNVDEEHRLVKKHGLTVEAPPSSDGFINGTTGRDSKGLRCIPRLHGKAAPDESSRTEN